VQQTDTSTAPVTFAKDTLVTVSGPEKAPGVAVLAVMPYVNRINIVLPAKVYTE
jgi:hypothetical protein